MTLALDPCFRTMCHVPLVGDLMAMKVDLDTQKALRILGEAPVDLGSPADQRRLVLIKSFIAFRNDCFTIHKIRSIAGVFLCGLGGYLGVLDPYSATTFGGFYLVSAVGFAVCKTKAVLTPRQS